MGNQPLALVLEQKKRSDFVISSKANKLGVQNEDQRKDNEPDRRGDQPMSLSCVNPQKADYGKNEAVVLNGQRPFDRFRLINGVGFN